MVCGFVKICLECLASPQAVAIKESLLFFSLQSNCNLLIMLLVGFINVINIPCGWDDSVHSEVTFETGRSINIFSRVWLPYAVKTFINRALCRTLVIIQSTYKRGRSSNLIMLAHPHTLCMYRWWMIPGSQ